jgi:hypothetical protein
MAVPEYSYQSVTHADLKKCLKWCVRKFNLRDWQITLITDKSAPDEIEHDRDSLGKMTADSGRLMGSIWVPIGRSKKENSNPYQILIHEMLHVLTFGQTRMSKDDSEIVSYRLEGPVYELYCLENKIKFPPIADK